MIQDECWRTCGCRGHGAAWISEVAVLADQPGLFGPVASDWTVWRLLTQLDARSWPQCRTRAAARESCGAASGGCGGCSAAGRQRPGRPAWRGLYCDT